MKAGYNLLGYLRRGGEPIPSNYAVSEFDRIAPSDYVGDVSIRGENVQMSVRPKEDVLLIRIREEGGLSRTFVLGANGKSAKRTMSSLAADLGAMVLPHQGAGALVQVSWSTSQPRTSKDFAKCSVSGRPFISIPNQSPSVLACTSASAA